MVWDPLKRCSISFAFPHLPNPHIVEDVATNSLISCYQIISALPTQRRCDLSTLGRFRRYPAYKLRYFHYNCCIIHRLLYETFDLLFTIQLIVIRIELDIINGTPEQLG